MSTTHCIITRFSFRFVEDDPIEDLLSDERLTERIRLFEKYCYPSIINQTNKNFYWIIIIDPLLPEEYVDQLQHLIDSHRDSDNYKTRGPREIWLHKWDWKIKTGKKLGMTDWILDYFESKPKYLITTRLDDDDCLVNTFINLVQKNMKISPVKGIRYLSFCYGYQHYVEKKQLRQYRLPMIALGLTLIAEINKYPACVYMGSHTKIPLYLRDPTRHDQMYRMYKENGDILGNSNAIRKQLKDRLVVIKTGGPCWVRNVHGFNLQKNIGRSSGRNQDPKKIIEVMKERFHVDL